MSAPTTLAPVARRRFRPQFGLRGLLAAVFFCSVCLALANFYVEPYRRQQRLMAEVLELQDATPKESFIDECGFGWSGSSSVVATPAPVESAWARFFRELFVDVEFVSLSNTSIDDSWTARLLDAPRLKHLYLDRTNVGNAGLVAVGKLPHLRSLSLDKTKVTDTGLKHLLTLNDLEDLSLAGSAITGPGLAHLRHLQGLKELDLNGCPIDDDGMAFLSYLEGLETVSLRDTQITDAGLAHLVGLRHLRQLDLWNTDVTEHGLTYLKRMPALSDVTLNGTQLIPSAGRHLWPEYYERRLRSKLREATVMDFFSTPLNDVVDWVNDYHKVNIMIDARSLAEANVPVDAVIDARIRDEPLERSLERILRPQGLKCVSRMGVLTITTVESQRPAQRRLIVKRGHKVSRVLSRRLYEDCWLELTNTPLGDVLGQSADVLHASFDLSSMPAAALNSPITWNLKWADSATALEFILDQLDLHAEIENNTIHLYPGPPPECDSRG